MPASTRRSRRFAAWCRRWDGGRSSAQRSIASSRMARSATRVPGRPALTVLAGGVGAAKFLRGLIRIADPAALTIIVNTGDDERFFGLAVSPDLDTITYTLAGVAHRRTGWGVDGDTFHCLEALQRFEDRAWFHL